MTCKVALVDSGIDINLYGKYIKEYIEFGQNTEDYFVCDANGHGTLCCSALLSVNPQVEIVAVKVLNEQNKCSSERLILALEQLIEMDINIINLSLATDSEQYVDKYQKVLNKLIQQGKVVLAATSNRKNTSTIAYLPETVGICGKIFAEKKEYWYHAKERLQCVANSTPALLKGLRGGYELFGGNSKATALFCGILSKYWETIRNISWNEKELLLEKYAYKTEWSEEEYEMDYCPAETGLEAIRNETIYQKLAEILIDELEISYQDVSNLHNKRLYEFGITRFNAITVIQRIENEFGVKIDYSKVNIFWFYSIDLLSQYIMEETKLYHE